MVLDSIIAIVAVNTSLFLYNIDTTTSVALFHVSLPLPHCNITILFLFLQVLIMPPMIRKQPYWYDRWYGSIMLVFESVFRQPQISNVFLLPAFPGPIYDKDCVHLTESSGLA